MYYFDYLRVRSALRVFTIILACVTLLVCVSLAFSHGHNGSGSVTLGTNTVSTEDYSGLALMHHLGETTWFPFGLFCGLAAMITIFFSNALATSLARYNGNLHFAFTKPISRERSALRTFAIDLAALFVGFLIALFFVFVPFAVVGLLGRLTFGPTSLAPIAIGLGIAFMWYGMVQAVTATMRGGAGLVLGLSWGVFAVMQGLQNLSTDLVPEVVVRSIHLLNILNPFIYLNAIFGTTGGHLTNDDTLDPHYFQSLATVWIVAIVALAIAVVQRKRMEV
jgi:hypothetical protein